MHIIVLVWVSTAFYMTSSVTSETSSNDDDEYGIILDGGSSGTKLKVYRWSRYRNRTSFDDRGVLKYDLTQEMGLKFPPGVGTKVNTISEIPDYFTPIMETAKRAVPKEKHHTTPLFFLATAGLRIYPTNVTETLLDAIEISLRNASLNPFYVPPEGAVRVISGEEEAVYAWVALNYLKGFFWSDRPPGQSAGVLEMGGGSTQIAFLPEQSVYANMYPVSMAGHIYRLYAHSYLFYGQNYIIERVNRYLIDQSDTDNPCMLRGDNTTVQAFDSTVLIRGSGNVSKCLEIINIFLQTADDKWCHPKPCAIGRTYQPPVGYSVFYAISAFAYSPKYLNAVDSLDRLDISLLRSNAEIYCQKTLQEVTSQGLPATYASPYCAMGLYIPTLLTEAYKFSPVKNTVYVKQEIGEGDIDWALGAMLMTIENRMANPMDPSCVSDPFISGGSRVTPRLTNLVFIALAFHYIISSLLRIS